jgi:hypothetical protein
MPLTLKCSVDLSGFHRFMGRVRGAFDCRTSLPMRQWAEQSGDDQLEFVRQRYVSASRGDGTWTPLAVSTKLARLRRNRGRNPRTGRQKLSTSQRRFQALQRTGRTEAQAAAATPMPILVDTGQRFRTLFRGGTDNVFVILPDGVRVGSTNPILGYHNKGGGRLPQRIVMVPPPEPLKLKMRQGLAVAAQRVVQGLVS